MRILLCLLLLGTTPAGAVDVTITIPDAAVPKINALCTRLQVEQGPMTPKQCVAWFLREGVRSFNEQKADEDALRAATAASKAARDALDADFPEPQ